MLKIHIINEHLDNAEIVRLRGQVEALQSTLEGFKARIARLEMLYGSEVQYNGALCDLCRSNGIDYNPIFSHSVRFPSDK